MRQQSYHHRAQTGGRWGSVVLLMLTVIGGAAAVYGLIVWFRSGAKKNDTTDVLAAAYDVAVTTPVITDVTATASMILGGGETAGTVYRRGTPEMPNYNMIVSLPGIATDGSMYEVWMVKDGLADVRSVGRLDARADGSWAKSFTMSDPLQYPNIVIMLEPNDGNSGPSGTIVAQGRFE
jgi:hypothetical protein